MNYHTIVYDEWLLSDLSDGAKVTLWHIQFLWDHFTGDWRETPTVERLSGLRKLSLRTVKLHFQELEAAGFITRERTPVAGGGSSVKIAVHPYAKKGGAK